MDSTQLTIERMIILLEKMTQSFDQITARLTVADARIRHLENEIEKLKNGYRY